MSNSIHGGDIFSYEKPHKMVDFSANINPLGIPKRVEQAMTDSIQASMFYPDPASTQLKNALGDWEQLPTEWIICGNGAADIIFRLAYALRPQKALILAPTFAEYEIALRAAGATVDYFTLTQDTNFAVDDTILQAITTDLDVLFICNPNNPTGVLTEPRLMKSILDKCVACNVQLIVDECFNDFLLHPEENSMRSYLVDFKNLFIIKAFTKIFAIPGVRLGYGLSANHELLHAMHTVAQAWSVSTIAQAAGIAAVAESAYVIKTRKIIEQGRDFLLDELNGMRYTTVKSQANYILFRTRELGLKEKLAKNYILIRNCANYKGLSNEYYRIAVRLPKENREFMALLRQKINDGEIVV